MGYYRNHAILVTFEEFSEVQLVREFYERILHVPEYGKLVTPIIPSLANGKDSFAILPDGSKEGWDLSDGGDEFRSNVIRDLRALLKRFEKERTPGTNEYLLLDWVEVQYGDENGINEITDDSDK